MKAVLFATGPTDQVMRLARTLLERVKQHELRVVAPALACADVQSALRGFPEIKINSFRLLDTPALLVRLWIFLGLSPAEVFCLSCGGGHRLLKLIAHGLRGRVIFVRADGRAQLGFLPFLWISLSRLWARETGALLVGSASPATLARLEEDLKRRRPGAHVYVLRNPSVADFFRIVRGWRRYHFLSIPWTNEGHDFLKAVAWLLPCGRREIYNEQGDSFSVRRVGVILRHIGRRFHLYFERRWLSLPPGVTVLGSASGYYLKGIVADLRRRHPGEPIHGLLPARLVKPARQLFDSITVLRPLAPSCWVALIRRSLGATRTGWYVIPCTNEGFYLFKLLGWMLPMGRREIYNENHDGYALRSWQMLYRHFRWRLYHRLIYQAFTERHGRSLPVHMFHLAAYPLRLVAGAGILIGTLLRGPGPAAAEARSVSELEPDREQPQEAFDSAER